MHHLRTILISLVAAACLVLGGCVGAPDSFGGASSGLLEVDSGTEPLSSLGEDDWQEAPAGCEDRLEVSERLTFFLASLSDHLVAAVDSSGDIICVDTVESVQEELEEQGDEESADDLGDSFLVAMTIAAVPEVDGLGAIDPMPRPSGGIPGMPSPPCEEDGPNECGDPTPQPNSDWLR